MKLTNLLILSQIKNLLEFLDLYEDSEVKNMRKSKLFEFQFINFCSIFVLTVHHLEELDKESRELVLFSYFLRRDEFRGIAKDLAKILRKKNGELPFELKGFLNCLDDLERIIDSVKSDLLKMKNSNKGVQ